MTLREIRHLAARGESHTVEFKRKASHPEKIIREMVAFANTDGGHLMIGVNDDGSIPGLKFPEEEMYVLEAAITKYCRPAFHHSVEVIPVSEDRSVVVYHIPSSNKKPHFVIEPNPGLTNSSRPARPHKRAFVRAEDKSVQASREMKEIIRRKQRSKGIRFNYGDKEKLLFDYLEKNPQITLEEFAELANISKHKASRTLVLLVLANVLEIIPSEKGTIYAVKLM